MNKTPFLSVIMPVYNAENYVKAAVNSVLGQSFKDLEIICVNDCSTDGSLNVLQQLAVADSRVKVIDSRVNVGAGAARNLGIEAAAGEYITFVDADDTIEPDLYERAVPLCEDGKVDEVVWGLIEEHYDTKDKLIRTVPIVPKKIKLNDRDKITEEVLKLEEATLFGYQWNSIYKAEVIKDHAIRFEKALFYEDYFFNLEFAKHMQSLATLDYAGYHYFKRVNSSITHRFTKDYFDLSYRRVNEMYDFCLSRNYKSDMLYRILGNKLLRYTLSALSRNCDPLAEMNFDQKKAWAREYTAFPLFEILLSAKFSVNAVFGILRFFIKKKLYLFMVLMGKMVHILKR